VKVVDPHQAFGNPVEGADRREPLVLRATTPRAPKAAQTARTRVWANGESTASSVEIKKFSIRNQDSELLRMSTSLGEERDPNEPRCAFSAGAIPGLAVAARERANEP
jgi:hypothetical protein